MRVTSELWVSAVRRRVSAQGGFAAVLRRGAAEAGAIFVLVRARDGALQLFGPAPQTAYDDSKPDERAFVLLPATDEARIAARLEREARFDADVWVLEVEPAGEGIGTGADALFPVTPA